MSIDSVSIKSLQSTSSTLTTSSTQTSTAAQAATSQQSSGKDALAGIQIGNSDAIVLDATFGTNTSESSPDSSSSGASPYTATREQLLAESNAIILNASLSTGSSSNSPTAPDFQALYNQLSAASKAIVDKVNELLKNTVPNGVQSLKPEDVTPEATAGRIVTGVTAFFDTYAKQHADLSGDKLVDSFVQEVTKGIDSGYSDALGILKGIGALDVEGVQDGLAQTRILIDGKLAAFASDKRKELSLPPNGDDTGAAPAPAEQPATPPGTTVNTAG